MTTTARHLIPALSLLLSAAPSGAGAVEEARYTVIERDGAFELRDYAPRMVAVTEVDGTFGEVGNEGFRRLVAYISGDNRARVASTAPDRSPDHASEIAMTAPVNQVRSGEGWRITFQMPAAYQTPESLPEPLDSRIVLERRGPERVAVVRYSGTWSRARYEERLRQLEEAMRLRGLVPAGEPVFARYDPPFMPWFMRRNEVFIPVAPDAP